MMTQSGEEQASEAYDEGFDDAQRALAALLRGPHDGAATCDCDRCAASAMARLMAARASLPGALR